MNLVDELFDLGVQRSAGRLGPIDYYTSLVRLIDASPDVTATQNESILTCIRRMEALLEDRIGASGDDLYQKMTSRSDVIPPELRGELHAISGAISRRSAINPVEIDGFQSRCAHALLECLRLAEAVSPLDPNIRIKAFLPAWTLRGIVRKVRHSQRPILPGRRHVQYFALVDLDGRLEIIRSNSPITIQCDDVLVLAGRAPHEANLYFNESRPSSNKKKSLEGPAWRLALLGALATLVGGALICFALYTAIPGAWDIKHIGRGAALIVAGGLTSWVGLWFATMMIQVARLGRAFDRALTGQLVKQNKRSPVKL